MYAAVARITHDDVNNARELSDYPEDSRRAELAVNVATLGVPLLSLVATAWLSGDPRLGLVMFAALYAGLQLYSGQRRASRRKRYLVALLRALRMTGESDIVLTRRFEKISRHHRSLAFAEVCAMPLIGLVVAVAQLSIVLVPSMQVLGASVISLAVLAVLGVALHLNRHHNPLRQEIRGALGKLPDIAIHE